MLLTTFNACQLVERATLAPWQVEMLVCLILYASQVSEVICACM